VWSRDARAHEELYDTAQRLRVALLLFLVLVVGDEK
jgi:hypothetical protein